MRSLVPAVVTCAIAGLPGAGSAQEAAGARRLVMPYQCSFDGDKLRVRPSEPRTYEVLGLHRQQSFTTCDAAGERCSTLAIHRFSISCGGMTVPWMRVAAAIGSPKPGRRWVDAGHLNIVRPIDAGAGSPPACREGTTTANGRECLPWKQRPQLERIVLPQGFAPLGEARLEATGGGPAQAAGHAPVAASAVKPAASAGSATSATGSAAVAPAGTHRKLDGTAPLATAGASTGVAAPVAAKPPAAEWVAVLEARDLSESSDAGSGSVAARGMLWAWLGGLAVLALVAAGVALLPHARSGKLRETAVRSAKMARVHVRVTRRSLQLSLAELAPRVVALRDTLGTRLLALRHRLWGDGPAPAVIGDKEPATEAPAHREDAAMASAAWQAATLLDEIERAVQGLAHSTPLRAVLEDELSSINQRLVVTRAASLDGGSPAKSASQYRALVRELERVRRIANSAAASLGGSRPALGMPSTKGEAYQLLGVNPDVSEGILKKLVDALRMTWHPDHARDEQDRLLREDRIKQINIAWDLINDKRAAA